jgi:NADH-quinone oxidoreductase subunit J
MLNLPDLLTFVLMAVATALAIAVVSTRQIFRAAVYLMLVLVVTAGLYLLLEAEFLAGIQVLVYVGGIVVVMVFAVMLTSSVELQETPAPLSRRLLGVLVSSGFFAVSAAAIVATPFATSAAPGLPVATIEATPAIGEALLDAGATGYVLPFELISLLLLTAVIGGIVIARKLPMKQPAAKEKLPTEAMVKINDSQLPPVMR